MNYEAHITVQNSDYKAAEQIAIQNIWSMSAITDDPILGPGAKAYLTAHDRDYMKLYYRLQDTTSQLQRAGIRVIREKIELIMYDTKEKK